jgi:hypothetical protein
MRDAYQSAGIGQIQHKRKMCHTADFGQVWPENDTHDWPSGEVVMQQTMAKCGKNNYAPCWRTLLEEIFYNKGPYQARVCGFFLAYHQVIAYCWWLLFRPTELERYCKFKVSLVRIMYLTRLYIFLVLMERNFSVGMRIRQV